jgi:hypothetical protein|tara:strand:+ start:3607 stop:3813 length:207 start_codon:yes stop_codon:yes gene_type:complete
VDKTVNIFIVQVRNIVTDNQYKIVGVYTTKEKADAAGFEACEMWEEGRMHHTVTILPLDGYIAGLEKN